MSIYYKPSLFNAHTMILIVHIFMNANKLCLNQHSGWYLHLLWYSLNGITPGTAPAIRPIAVLSEAVIRRPYPWYSYCLRQQLCFWSFKQWPDPWCSCETQGDVCVCLTSTNTIWLIGGGVGSGGGEETLNIHKKHMLITDGEWVGGGGEGKRWLAHPHAPTCKDGRHCQPLPEQQG